MAIGLIVNRTSRKSTREAITAPPLMRHGEDECVRVAAGQHADH
jgi:hypothetical protein